MVSSSCGCVCIPPPVSGGRGAGATRRQISAISSVSHIHKAIRDEEFDHVRDCILEEMKIIIKSTMGGVVVSKEASHSSSSLSSLPQSQQQQEQQPQLKSLSSLTVRPFLWQANPRGWTTLHFAACYHTQCTTEWWKWILQQAVQEVVATTSTTIQLVSRHTHHPPEESFSPSSDSSTKVKKEQAQKNHSCCCNNGTTSGTSTICSGRRKKMQQQQQQQHLVFFQRPNDMGQTCVDLFFRHAWNPLSFQRPRIQEQAKQLRQAVQWICQLQPNECYDDQIIIQQVRYLIEEQEQDHRDCNHNNDDSSCGEEENHPHPPSLNHNHQGGGGVGGVGETATTNAMIAVICKFWRHLELLLDALYQTGELPLQNKADVVEGQSILLSPVKKEEGISDINQEEEKTSHASRCYHLTTQRWILHQLTNLGGGCPHWVIRLVLQLYPTLAQQSEPQLGRLPLHVFCSTPSRTISIPPITTRKTTALTTTLTNNNHSHSHNDNNNDNDDDDDDPTASILRILIQAHPSAAQTPDPQTGRYPLQLALASEFSFSSLQTSGLWQAYPNALYDSDPYLTTATGDNKCPLFVVPCLSTGEIFDDKPQQEQQVEWLAKQLILQPTVESGGRSTTASSSSPSLPSSSCGAWSYLPRQLKQRALQQAREQLDCQQLDTIFQILRQHPNALLVD